MKPKYLHLSLMALTFLSTSLMANTKDMDHLPIGHCYHWLSEASNRFLSYKYNYAQQNNGELTFYTTGGNGAVAGPGLYCAKTPGDSYSYGDRVIRIDLVDDVVMYDETTGRQYCGKNGNFYPTQAECNSKPWDIKFYSGGGRGNFAWYVIRNPQAVQLWSANSDQLVADLNAEKSFESSGYQIHADNTITLIKAETGRMGARTFQNPNARLSIVKILNDPTKLAQTPPLTVIALTYNYQGGDLSDSTKKKVYSTQFSRALRDTKLSFSDVLNVTKMGQVIESAFTAEISKLDVNNLSAVNPVLVLQAADRFTGAIQMSDLKIKSLWRSAILSAGDLNSLVETSLKKDGALAKALDSSLPSRSELQTKLTSYNVVSLVKILNLYIDQGTLPTFQDSFRYLLKELLTTKGPAFADTFDKLTNTKLNKEHVLATVITSEILIPGGTKDVDPIAVGLALDRAKNSIDDNTLAQAKSKIVSLPIKPDANRLTYQILEDLNDGKFSLPSFYPETVYLVKLIDRSLKERAISKTPTNTFRMVMSGFFTFYNNKVRKERDDKKKSAISQQAGDDLFAIADELNTPERGPYLYITVQNASFFKGNGRYQNHPIDAAFAQYNTGDANFDKAFENAVLYSFDGSILQFLAYFGDKDKKAQALLVKYVQVLLDPSSVNMLRDQAFITSQAEKKSWSNIITNTNYSPWNNNRVPSNICQVAAVALRYNTNVKKLIDGTTASNLKDWADDLNDGFCKK